MTYPLPRNADPTKRSSPGTVGATASVANKPYSKVSRQDQPHGEDGIRFSLKKVCLLIAEGRLHPDVRAWTTKVLKDAGNPKGPKARAKALLEALRAQSGWVPDPTDAEFMPGAHLMLGDGVKEAFFSLGDCDDLTIALGSAILAPIIYLTAAESVGTKAAVVGHAYGPDRMIEHVLGAIYDPNDNLWYYVDPSLKDMPFGECRPFTRERVYLVPSAELFCDDRVCLKPGGKAAGPPPMPRRGDFVQVSGTLEMDAPQITTHFPTSWEAVMDGEPVSTLGDIPNIDGRRSENGSLVDMYDVTGILEATVTFKKPPTAEQVINQAKATYWMDLTPCSDPLRWCQVNPPASQDYAGRELLVPWHDGLEPTTGEGFTIPNSGFPSRRTDFRR